MDERPGSTHEYHFVCLRGMCGTDMPVDDQRESRPRQRLVRFLMVEPTHIVSNPKFDMR
jgi:hypothetical protein